MKCPKCHSDNPDTQRFCGECGTQIIPQEEIPVTKILETPTEELTRGSTFFFLLLFLPNTKSFFSGFLLQLKIMF